MVGAMNWRKAMAEKRDCHVEVVAAPGAFVRRGQVLARVSLPACDKEAQNAFCSAFAIGDSRSYDQDPRFGLIVLGEIAAKALSPGINDPGTAIQVVSTGVRLMDIWALERGQDDKRTRRNRLMTPGISEDDLLDDIFGPVARYGAGDVAVAIRLQKGLRALASIPRLTAPVRTIADQALERSHVALPIPADYARVKGAAEGS